MSWWYINKNDKKNKKNEIEIKTVNKKDTKIDNEKILKNKKYINFVKNLL